MRSPISTLVADGGEGMDVDVLADLGGGADHGQRADADAASGRGGRKRATIAVNAR